MLACLPTTSTWLESRARTCAQRFPRRPSPSTTIRSWRPIVSWAGIWKAAATGSVKTATSVGIESGTAWRFWCGTAMKSANAPSWLRMPRTERWGQWLGRPARHVSHVQAAAVDFADDAAAGQRACLSHADELVAEDALKSHVAAHELQVRLADTCAQHLDHDFAVAKPRLRVLAACRDAVLTEYNRAHIDYFPWNPSWPRVETTSTAAIASPQSASTSSKGI